ncbi:recombinase family protein [Brevibacillus fulvus]|uniref:Site-specific DNA recombinase n=1 Tax=Brevibacillus fulvus TaxID=1125967 RepID=A0A938XT35_9BACL|nr:recombinase family protein [Brevibacillus fulvus]MBM7589943.1 site-specific DNA recombinase [Brevibacillus fulvus]
MVGIYARVSTEEQAKSGFSLQDQIRECRRKAGGETVIEYIDEGVSGEILDRPALTRLRQDAKRGVIRKVICLDPDRLSRKLMNQLIITDELDQRGIELLFVNGEYAKTPEGNLFYSMRGAIAEFEKAKINERMSRGRKEKARQGRVLRDFKIFGYDYCKEQEKFIINEAEAEIVRLIFNLFTTPQPDIHGINGIARYLTEQGVPTKRGAAVWHRQVVRQILANRTYIGEFYQNRWNTEGMLANRYKQADERRVVQQRPRDEWICIPCPAIVDKAQFEHAQQLLKESRRRWAGKAQHQYLLSGLLRCGECGNTMTGQKASHWGKTVFLYSDRKNTQGAKQPGCGHTVLCEQVDQLVWQSVNRWLGEESDIQEAERLAVREQQQEQLQELARLKRELAKAKNAQSRLLTMLVEHSEMADELEQALRQAKEKITRITKQLQRMEATNIEVSGATSPEHDAVRFYLEVAPEQLTDQDRRELIRRVVREIKVYKSSPAIEIYTF